MLVDVDAVIEQLDIAECNNCRFGGTYCADCKLDLDAHKILEVINDLPKIGECKDCKHVDFLYGADVETCYCLSHCMTVCSDDFCSYFEMDTNE